jgi:hypothetical protein
VERSIAFNKEIAASTNELLLLNTLRARARLPTYYTRLTSATESTTFTPSASMALPLGPGAVKKGFAPTFSFGDNAQNQLTLQNLDDQKFMRGVLSPVSVDVLSFYLRQGWPAEVLLMVTVSRISVTQDAAEALIQAFETRCAADANGEYCNNVLPVDVKAPAHGQYIAEQLRTCLASARSYTREGNDTLVLQNYPTNTDQTSCFQWMMRVLISLGPTPRTADAFDVVARDVPLGKTQTISSIGDLDKQSMVMVPGKKGLFTICKRRKVSGLSLLHFAATLKPTAGIAPADTDPTTAKTNNIPFVLDSSRAPGKEGCGEPNAPASQPQVQLTTRSFDGMVYYLGEVLRADGLQTGGQARPASVTVWAWGQDERAETWGLFVAIQGTPPAHSPVDVDYDGDTYYVPSACDDTTSCGDPQLRHRSLQVLSLLNQIWGLQKEAAELPVTPTVTVINP